MNVLRKLQLTKVAAFKKVFQQHPSVSSSSSSSRITNFTTKSLFYESTATTNNHASNSVALVFLFLMSLSSCAYAEEATAPDEHETKLNLPVYRLDEIAAHTTREKGIWVTYKGQVYDITKFLPNHPGGRDKILMAAGKDIEPFWNLYRQHYNSPLPMELLRSMLIGTMHEEDLAQQQRQFAAQSTAKGENNPYRDDPVIPSVMKVYNATPINAEAPRVLETDHWITPVELWFVRNHHPVPHIADLDSYRLSFTLESPPNSPIHDNDSNDKTEKVLRSVSLQELQARYPALTIASSVQCGGNRRSEMNSVAYTNGIAWEISAISTAQWTGVRLRDVLYDMGVTEDSLLPGQPHAHLHHVQFVALDGMQASIPIRKALDRYGDVLLAYDMNGAELAQKHGYPLRVIVPGHAGVRNVKWLQSIRLSAEEAYGPWQRGMAYKGFGPSLKSLEDVDVEKIPSLQEQPVQSAIAYPAPNERIPANSILTAKGYAYSGGGRGIVRIDASIDGGKTWHTARLTDGADQPLDRAWAWTFWECDFPLLAEEAGRTVQLICKATDAAYNVQPDSIEGIWNLRGINNNAWHRITVHITDPEPEEDYDDEE